MQGDEWAIAENFARELHLCGGDGGELRRLLPFLRRRKGAKAGEDLDRLLALLSSSASASLGMNTWAFTRIKEARHKHLAKLNDSAKLSEIFSIAGSLVRCYREVPEWAPASAEPAADALRDRSSRRRGSSLADDRSRERPDWRAEDGRTVGSSGPRSRRRQPNRTDSRAGMAANRKGSDRAGAGRRTDPKDKTEDELKRSPFAVLRPIRDASDPVTPAAGKPAMKRGEKLVCTVKSAEGAMCIGEYQGIELRFDKPLYVSPEPGDLVEVQIQSQQPGFWKALFRRMK